MEFLRKVDFDRLVATSERVSQTLIGHDSGASSCSVNCIKTPPGEGSPAGLHKHLVDQPVLHPQRHHEPGNRGQAI